MLTLLRRGGFRFYVKSGSAQEKPHIYVTRDGEAWAKFTLKPVGPAANVGLSRNDLVRLQGVVGDLEPQLLQLWWEFASNNGVKPEPEKDKHAKKHPQPQEAPAPPQLEGAQETAA